MSNLHAYFALRNQQGFSKALDGSRGQVNAQSSIPSSSGGKSWTRTNALSSLQPIDVNARDWLGRTVLHLACAVAEPFALAYVRLLLAHPNINVNLQDTESRWTALHRALYAGNIAACQLLLQRFDIDVQVRDHEGLNAFDLYNSTVDGTQPKLDPTQPGWDPFMLEGYAADLFTWGGNRNAALGHGDSDDRAYPDQVILQRPEALNASSSEKLTLIQVEAVAMAKLHTTIITNEPRGNLRVCGFGSGGRLGPGQHTQYNLLPVPQFTHHIVAVAPGQDHTLAVTSEGEVLSWGLNRFSQLGYVVEPAGPTGPFHARSMEEPIQAVARKVVGPLKKEKVVGVAACKTASACWSYIDVFTWGTNNGQLGYDKNAQPVQVLPRTVTGVEDVVDLTLTDSAMACLLSTMDVICFRDDSRFRVKFPIPELSNFPPYVHPFVVKPLIVKITSCDGVFGALSGRGDVFTFTAPSAAVDGAADRAERAIVKPQRVWSQRKSFDPVRDIALGSDGEMILCTRAGSVFVRSRSSSKGGSGKALKFHRVPFIHRVVKVCANSTGAFAALRLNYTPKRVTVSGPSLVIDLQSVRPWLSFEGAPPAIPVTIESEDEGEALNADVADVSHLCALLAAEKHAQKTEGRGLFRGPGHLAHGADVFVCASLDIPSHRLILAARSTTLRALMDGRTSILKEETITVRYHEKGTGLPRLLVTGCHPTTVLLLLEYLYSDDVPALWDRRVTVPCTESLTRHKINPTQVKAELESMARILDLSALSAALAAGVKRVPTPTLGADMQCLSTESESLVIKPDVFLELADRNVACHSVILRARCPFFRSFFDDEDWTVNRWTLEKTLTVGMKHFEWRALSFVMRWLYTGEEKKLFDDLGSVNSVQDLLDIIFSVMAVASELLLDKLMLMCSALILRHVTLHNAPSILADAMYYNALSLVDSLHDYIASNLEAFLDSSLLDGMHSDLIKSLTDFVCHRQADKSPVMRSNLIAETALRNSSSWLDLQDIPQPLVRSTRATRESPKLSPVAVDKPAFQHRASMVAASPLSSPVFGAKTKPLPSRTTMPSQGDEIFTMDVPTDTIPALTIGQPQTPPANYTILGQPWKSKPTYGSSKVDMKTVMAETAANKFIAPSFSGTTSNMQVASTDTPELNPPGSSRLQKPSQRQRRKVESQVPDMVSGPTPRVPSSGSPWKLPAQQTSTVASPVSASVRGPQPNSPPFSPPRTEELSPSPRAVAKVSGPQPATPSSILQVSNALLRPAVVPDLVPKRAHTDGPAWTNTPIQETIPAAGMSFTAIQQQQLEQVQEPKGKRSLREIQEEEQAKQEEEDFLKWWKAEEERLKAEGTNAPLSSPGAGSSNKRERGGRQGRRGARGARGEKRGQGRNRGGNQT